MDSRVDEYKLETNDEIAHRVTMEHAKFYCERWDLKLDVDSVSGKFSEDEPGVIDGVFSAQIPGTVTIKTITIDMEGMLDD